MSQRTGLNPDGPAKGQEVRFFLIKSIAVLSSFIMMAFSANVFQDLLQIRNANADVTIAATADSLASSDSSATTTVAWYNNSWLYRKAVNIGGSTSGVQTDYQIAITVPYSSKMKADFSDVRFANTDGKTLLNYWLESSVSKSTAVFYVKIPNIAASPSNTTIYMYYGNSQAKDASDGSKTFSFYDGFNTAFGASAFKNATTYQKTPTYDGSGQAVHPDVVYFSSGWKGYKYWMVMTPFPGANASYENPSIIASSDGVNWKVPSGLVNPLDAAPKCGWNNDPSLMYNPTTKELWLYYLETSRSMDCAGYESEPIYNHSYLKLVKSSDGIKWSSPQTVIDWDLSNYELMLSPSVVRMSDNLYYLWMTNGYDAAFRYTSTDGINWTAREQINTPDYAWHMNVKYIPEKSEYWMLYNYPAQHGMLKFARSTDGMNWTTYPNAVMMSSTSGWDTNLYRSTFVYDNTTSQFKIWYSAYTDEQIWHIGYVNKTYSDMLNALSAPSGWTKWNGLGFWMTSSDIKKRGTYSGKLIQLSGYENNQMIIHKDAPFQNNFYEECDMYDDLASDAFKMFRIHGDGEVGLGVYSGSSNDYYSFHSNSYEYTNTNQKRTLGWHKFGILLKADSSVAFFIDGINVGTLSSQFNDATAISIEGLSLQPSTFYIDDIRVRKYADSEPSLNSFGAETAK